MKVLIIGKAPPIQGGVSWHTQCTALELARRGHEVHLLTNADEVEPGFRQLYLRGDADRAAGLDQPSFQRHDLSPLTSFGHVPESPAYGSRLLGKALALARALRPDFIVGWYFEPYGLAAAQAALANGIRYGIIHAGSDLGQLAHHPDLYPAYAWMAGSATAVFAGVGNEIIEGELDRLDVPAEARRHLKGFEPLHESFRQPTPLDFTELRQAAAPHLAAWPLAPDLLRPLGTLNDKLLVPGVPLIGIYGKVGEQKGTYDLVAALAQLAERGVRFQLVALAAGAAKALARFVAAVLGNDALAQRTWIFPPIAPWRVSGFLRRCDLVCFMERGFGISYHSPAVPLEVLASSVCLLCAREIADKPLYRYLLRHEESCLVVDNPRDVAELSGRLLQVLDDVDLRDRLAQCGCLLTAALQEQLVAKQMCRHVVADAIEACA